MPMAACCGIHPRFRALATSACAVASALLVIGISLDIALQRRAIYLFRLKRHWWGRQDEGCWLAERSCVPARGGSEATPAVWWLETSERHCFQEAAKYWRECLNPVRGFVAATYRPRSEVVARPEKAMNDPMIQPALVSVTLRGSPGLLLPGGLAWVLEVCEGAAPCLDLSVGDFCDAGVLELQTAWPRLETGCQAVLDGSWPKCGASTPLSACYAAETAAAELAAACQQFCPLARHAHQLFWLSIPVALIVVCTVLIAILQRRWRRHFGCMVSLVAVGGAASAIVTNICISLLEVDVAFRAAANLSLDGKGVQIGGVLLFVIAILFAAVAFLVVGASKNEKILQYKLAEYDKFNSSLRTKNLHRPQHPQQSDQDEGESLSVMHGECIGAQDTRQRAFELTGDEEQIGYSDGVMTRSPQRPKSPAKSPPKAKKKSPSPKKPHVLGPRDELDLDPVMPRYTHVDNAWIDDEWLEDSEED